MNAPIDSAFEGGNMPANQATEASDVPLRVIPTSDDRNVPERLVVQIEKGDAMGMVRKIERIAAEDPNIYQRERELVTVSIEPGSGVTARNQRAGNTIRLLPGTPRITPLGYPALRARTSELIDWQRYDRRAKEWIQAGPDSETIQSLLDVGTLGGWPNVRPLRGIRECPYLSPSGRAVTKSGYDAETALLLRSSVDVGTIPEEPTQEQARAALQYLWTELFADFPYSGLGESDNTRDDTAAAERYRVACDCPEAFVAVAAILTVIARPAIQGATLSFLFEANTQGAGKSLQSHVVSLVTTGRPANVATYPTDRDGRTNDEEMKKTICAYALAGTSLICFDNIRGEIGGGALESAMTAEDMWEGRKLGVNDNVTLPWSSVILLNGNNAIVSPDIAQRVAMARLESDHENPRDKPSSSFRHADLKQWTREHRGRLVRACLVILRAYVVAKDKPQLNLGSFEQWAALIPSAIVYAGGPNVIEAQPRGAATESSENQAYRALLQTWPSLEFPNGAKLGDLVKHAAFEHEREIDRGNAPPDGLSELRAALRALVNAKSESTPKTVELGHALRAFRGKWLDGAKLDSREDRKSKTQVWSITRRVVLQPTERVEWQPAPGELDPEDFDR